MLNEAYAKAVLLFTSALTAFWFSSRIGMRAQAVDATPSRQLIRQHFPVESRFVQL
jgi:hypothetical protein